MSMPRHRKLRNTLRIARASGPISGPVSYLEQGFGGIRWQSGFVVYQNYTVQFRNPWDLSGRVQAIILTPVVDLEPMRAHLWSQVPTVLLLQAFL